MRTPCVDVPEYVPTPRFARLLNDRFVHDELYVHMLDGCYRHFSASVIFQALSMKWGQTHLFEAGKSSTRGLVVGVSQALCFYNGDGFTAGLDTGCAPTSSPAVYPYRSLFPLDAYAEYNELVVAVEHVRVLASFSTDRHAPAPYFLDVHNLTHPFSVWPT